jgi:branched-chain amino acid transport system substrate-binding protein
MANLGKKRMTRRDFLKTSGKTAGVIGSALAFPEVLKSKARAAGDTIKVGVLFSLSGPYGAGGSERAEGVQFAIEQINAKGGLLGKKVEAIVRDEQAHNPGVAATRAKELVEKEEVKFLIGGTSSATAPAMRDQTVPHKVLLFICCMADSIITTPGFDRTVFHPYPSTAMFAKVNGRYAAKNFGTKWYFFIADYAWGWDNFKTYKAVLDEFKGTNLGVSAHPLGASDYSPYITKIMAAKPEVLIVINGGRDQINSWKSLREFGAFEKMKIFGGALYYQSVLASGVDAFWGGYGGTPFYWEDELETTRTFVEAFTKKYNRPPMDNNQEGYTGMMELASGIQRAGTLDPDKIIAAMEGHQFQWTKGPEYWRKCDHQSIQDMYVITPKKPKKKYDIFQIVDKMGGENIAQTCEELGHKKN